MVSITVTGGILKASSDLISGRNFAASTSSLSCIAALRLAFFSADKLFAADGDWGTVSETNKTTTTTDDAEAQA